MTEVVALKSRQERLWEAYLAAFNKAERTQDIQDGIAAGKAWAAFIADFLTPSDPRG